MVHWSRARLSQEIHRSRSNLHCIDHPGQAGYSGSAASPAAIRSRWLLRRESTEFAWSPDSKSIAYVGPAGGGFDILTVAGTTGGQARRITSTLRFKRQPRWSADGKWIAFITVQDNGNSDLRAVSRGRANDARPYRLTRGGRRTRVVSRQQADRVHPTNRYADQHHERGLKTNTMRKLADGPAWNLAVVSGRKVDRVRRGPVAAQRRAQGERRHFCDSGRRWDAAPADARHSAFPRSYRPTGRPIPANRLRLRRKRIQQPLSSRHPESDRDVRLP